MYDGGINADILKNEINSFLKRVANYRSRLVVNTCRADYSFQLGVFGFQHFISDFTKSLSPSIGLDMVDVLNVNNHVLLDKARRTLAIDTDEGRATMERLDTLCGTQYDHAPMISKRLKHDDAVDAAREALRRYMDASLVLFAADMKAKGFSGGIEEMEHIFGPVREMLNPVNDVSYSRTFHR